MNTVDVVWDDYFNNYHKHVMVRVDEGADFETAYRDAMKKLFSKWPPMPPKDMAICTELILGRLTGEYQATLKMDGRQQNTLKTREIVTTVATRAKLMTAIEDMIDLEII